MELLRNPRIDFLGKKIIFVSLSALLVLGSVALLATRGLHYGIDFRGGADVVLRFKQRPQVDEIRSVLARQGLDAAQIQAFGGTEEGPASQDVLIRVPPQEGTEQGDVSGRILEALRSAMGGESGKLDLNIAGPTEIERALQGAFPGQESMARAAAEALSAYRDEHGGLFRDLEEARSVAGLSPEAAAWLRDNATAGPFAIRSVDYVGPSVGRELKQRATYAVIGSLLAMLVYIWFRFERLSFGVAAVVTLGHDAMLALGAISLTTKEFDLTVLAAVLTIVGFSINDTIVIFDRVRENLRHGRGGDMNKLFNDSINQTLSRTLLTTALVLMVVLTLWLFGGNRLNPFSFTLLVGVIFGSYSTIYVASPIVIWWERTVGKKARA
ncbi:MAG TPA: protein translocase subunit SecF [Candidatus Polarisedimenticolia bacterium]|nr:protein translocase subunit SecF [Candidatus Polarisedimenticolia bacterium]